MKKFYAALIVYNLVMLVAAIGLLGISKTDLIIYMNIHMADRIYMLIRALLALIFISENVFLILKLFAYQKAIAAIPAPTLAFTPNDPLSTDRLRAELEKYRQIRPSLQNYIETVQGQMDSIDRKQAKIRHIFARNQIDTLGDVEKVISFK